MFTCAEEYDRKHPVDCSNGANGTTLLVLKNETFFSAVRQCPYLFVLTHMRTKENPFYAATENELRNAIYKVITN